MEIKELLALTGLSETEIRARLRDILLTEKVEKKKRKKYIPQHSPVKTTVCITRIYTCTHCGTKRTVNTDLSKDEELMILGKDGKVQRITVHSPSVVECYTGWCGHCDAFILNLPVDELQRRYRMLKRKEVGIV